MAKQENKPDYNQSNIDPMFNLLSDDSQTQNISMTVQSKQTDEHNLLSKSIDSFKSLNDTKNRIQNKISAITIKSVEDIANAELKNQKSDSVSAVAWCELFLIVSCSRLVT